jgi:peptidoglycan-associated lipoprotein
MNKKVISLLSLALLGFTFTSCHRTRAQVWEDTKTASRYMNKGIGSFFGRHVNNHEIANAPRWKEEPEFMPLSDDSRYQSSNSSMNEYPIAKESPGDPGSSIPGIDAFSSPMGALAKLFSNIHFETDHYTVHGTEAISTLHEIADYLIKHPQTYVFVEGHADERGPASYNLALGSKRSNSVRSFLIDKGVSPNQLFSISYGKERPLVEAKDESGWFENRRAQFKIYER